MLGMMNTNTMDSVEFYAASPSSRQIDISDISTFSQPKKRVHISYTNDGRRFVDGKLEAGQTTLEPQTTWDKMILNSIAKQQVKLNESELQRKNSAKKSVMSLRKFLPFGSKSDSKSKASKKEAKAAASKTKSICPQGKKCITVVE
ncbi:hypothetical protein M3Y97_00591500 [Aphelenchoides bicaudatus]|nr:hypothetical protein M3Y97_00591500 [Aphelenchoides bicaudatus]